jgi:hypothetical protein
MSKHARTGRSGERSTSTTAQSGLIPGGTPRLVKGTDPRTPQALAAEKILWCSDA